MNTCKCACLNYMEPSLKKFTTSVGMEGKRLLFLCPSVLLAAFASSDCFGELVVDIVSPRKGEYIKADSGEELFA